LRSAVTFLLPAKFIREVSTIRQRMGWLCLKCHRKAESAACRSQCGKACLSENSLTIFRGYASNCRHSLQNDLSGFYGKASLTALESGKPQRNVSIATRRYVDSLLRQNPSPP
jgi:hypothetical protein